MEVIQEKMLLGGWGGEGRKVYQEGRIYSKTRRQEGASYVPRREEVYSSWCLECERGVVISEAGATIRG